MNKFSSVHALVFDLDGTLLNSKKELSNRNKEAIIRCFQLGFHLFIATARPPRSVKQLIPREILDRVTAIYYNGAFVENVEGATISFTIPATESGEIIDTLCDHREWASIAMESEDILYALSNEAYENNKKHLSPPEIISPSDMKKIPAHKILLFNLSSESKRYILKDVNKLNIVETDSKELIQIMAANVSKSRTLSALCLKMNISMTHVMSFGDDWNDLDMFKNCGYSVAMGNANPELKKLAKMITQSNDQDGVAQVIEKLI